MSIAQAIRIIKPLIMYSILASTARKFRPVKIEQRAHIDGFVSVIDAMTVRQKYWEECGELLKNAA